MAVLRLRPVMNLFATQLSFSKTSFECLLCARHKDELVSSIQGSNLLEGRKNSFNKKL